MPGPIIQKMPKVTPTGGDPTEEFYDSSVGQMSLAQDDFSDPALVDREEMYTESLSDMMSRDQKVTSELAALRDLGFDISTPEKIDRLRPLMWKDVEDYAGIPQDSYTTLLNTIAPSKPALENKPVEQAKPMQPPVTLQPPGSTGPKEVMPSYDDIVQMAQDFIQAQDNPNQGKFWVERQIIKKRIMLNESGHDGDAFESQIRSLMKSLSNPSFDD